MNKLINFGIYLTGHDRETVVQMYNNYTKYLPQKTGKVKRSHLTGVNLLDKAINSQKPL
jgi:ribosomal protein S6